MPARAGRDETTAYFSVLDEMILEKNAVFSFQGRSRRRRSIPSTPCSPFADSLLAHDCAAALESVGLDAYVGFLHRDRPGRSSLALDLMEELRPVWLIASC
ncbi:MAG: CRISPR-associated endonuclease Cas1 [Oscillospiraceae bacterium]